MFYSTNKWVRIPLFNFLLTAFIGVFLRYKIAFSLPFVYQKNLLHGHSHFAFSGWVSQILMFLIVKYLTANKEFPKKYERLLWVNFFTATGMLITFIIQGYGLFSIIFSIISILISYLFALYVLKDIKQQAVVRPSYLFIKAAIFFNVLSSLGAFSLAFIMANKIVHQEFSLFSVYFFLHFQYNGWFLFACMGLLAGAIDQYLQNFKQLRTAFWMLFVSCIPSFFLSAFWLKLPWLIHLLILISAFVQLIGWCFFLKIITRQKIFFNSISSISRMLLLLSGTAATIKFLLQLGSLAPSLSTLAFGFRPIVIGYLHLVFLGAISIFIVAYCSVFFMLHTRRRLRAGIFILTIGVILNELILMIQGLADIYYIFIPNLNIALLCVAIVMFIGLVLINLSLSGNSAKVCSQS